MQEWRPPAPVEIDHKLRQDFSRRLLEYGITTQQTDPILAVLFRSFAAQVAEVYQQAAETIPQTLLDELMTGLGMPERRAQAAQVVMQCKPGGKPELFEAGTLLIGEAEDKKDSGIQKYKLTFALDAPLTASQARIGMVAIYRDGMLRLHHGTDLAKEWQDARPSFEPVAAELGTGTAIYLAVEVDAQAEHLSNHGFWFELDPEARDLAAYLKREVWCLINSEGRVSAEGLLRPRAGNAGVRRLEWLIDEVHSGDDATILPEGFYGSRLFLFPTVPPGRQFLVATPKEMEAPLRRIFQSGEKKVVDSLLMQKRAWIRIGLPQAAATIAEDLRRVILHCATASNIETYNQTIYFDQQGTTIPIVNNSGRVRHLISSLAIKGEGGTNYQPETEPGADENVGRYRFRQGRLEITPARTARGIPDHYTNVSLLIGDGTLGNSVGAGKITTFLNRTTSRTLEIKNLTAAAGGTNGESLSETKARFADLLLSRERPITLADLEATVRAFEPKISVVDVASALERRSDGLHRIQQITIHLNRESFTAPEAESKILQRELEAELQSRSLLGLQIKVKIKWMNE